MAQNAYPAPQRPYPQPIGGPSPSYSNHIANPPVARPYQSQQTTQKPPPKSRSFSFRSDRSGKSHGSHINETHEEKEAKRLHSKADPTLAMSEAEPSAVAAGVKSSLAPLRAIQHKDALGNPIADPDKSNPTRSRWERPLDTIRSFEAAIDGAYNARRSYVRAESDSAMTRPRSYYPPRFPQESYYSSRPTSYRPDSMLELPRQQARDSYLDPQAAQYPSNAYQSGNRQRYSRMQSEPGLPNYYNRPRQAESGVYPLPNNHRSYETVASGASGASGGGSASGGEASGYTTDPTSSDNSSIDRNGPPSKPAEPANDYGINFGHSYQPPAQTLFINGPNGKAPSTQYNSQPANGNSYAVKPPQPQYQPSVPRKDVPILRKPMSTPVMPQSNQPQQEKRKSWLARRFSKRA